MIEQNYRLPKLVEAAPGTEDLLANLAAHAEPLWEGGHGRAVRVAAGEPVLRALAAANEGGVLVRGLEGAERRLAEEQRGLEIAAARQTSTPSVRISRLLVMTDDGAERFYRNVDSLLRRHGPRLFAIRLETDEHTLGSLLFGADRIARLVLLEHKSAVAELLLAVARQFDAGASATAD